MDHGLPRSSHDLDRVIPLPVLQLLPVLDRLRLLVRAWVRVRACLVVVLLSMILRIVPRHVLALALAHLLVAVLGASIGPIIPGGALALVRIPVVTAVAWGVLRTQILLVLLGMVDLLWLLHVLIAAAVPVHFDAHVGSRGVGTCRRQDLLAVLGCILHHVVVVVVLLRLPPNRRVRLIIQRFVRQVLQLLAIVTYSRQFRVILFISLLISIRGAGREIWSQGAHFHHVVVLRGLSLMFIFSLRLPVAILVRPLLSILSWMACIQVLALGRLLAVFR